MTPDQTQAFLAAVRQLPDDLGLVDCRALIQSLADAVEQAQRERDKLQVQLTRAESALAVVAVTGIAACLD